MRKNAKKILAAAAVTTMLGGSWACAASLTWDVNGATAGTGGTGTWDSVSSLWDNAGSFTTWNSGTPDAAVFGGTAGTVTLAEPITAASITINSQAYVIDLNGNALTSTGGILGTGGSNYSTVAITNTAGGPAATFTTGSFVSGSGPRLSGNMNVTYTGAAWTPSISTHDFTGTLSLLGTGLVRSDGVPLGSDTGNIILGATASLQLGTASSTTLLYRTFNRNIELASNTQSMNTGGFNTLTLAGIVSGASTNNLRLAATQGLLVLAGDNTYSGSTHFLAAGTAIAAAHNNGFGNSTLIETSSSPGNPQAVTIGFTNNINVGTTPTGSLARTIGLTSSAPGGGLGMLQNYSGNNTFSGFVNLGSNTQRTIATAADSSLTLTGVVQQGRGFIKFGLGTLVLTGQNTYGTSTSADQGATTVNQGTLRLDFSQTVSGHDSDILNFGNVSNTAATYLRLGGGTLEIKGKSGATNSQRFENYSGATAGLGHQINSGGSYVKAVQNSATSLSANLGQIRVRAVGGTVDITLPTTGAITIPVNSGSNTLNTGAVNALVAVTGTPFMTVNGTDWAARDASANIVSGASLYTANTATTLTDNADMSAGTDTALGGSTAITSLRFGDSTAARTVTIGVGQTLNTGGILVSSGVGANASTITTGTLTAAAGTTQDLVVHQHNTAAPLAISSDIVDNGATASGFTKSGPGRLILSGTNTYTGATTVNEGMLKLESAGAIPGGIDATVVGSESALTINGGAVIGLNGDFTRAVGSGPGQVRFLGSGGFAAYGGDRTIAFGGVTTGVAWNAANFIPTMSRLILGATDADGTVIYSNAINLSSGAQSQVTREIEVIDGSAAVDARFTGVLSSAGEVVKLGTGTMELAAVNTYVAKTYVNAGTLLITGTSVSPTFVSPGTSLNIGNGGTAGQMSSTGTITNNGNVTFNRSDNSTYSGAIIAGNGTVTKEGAGTLFLTGTNTYTGATIVNAGVFSLGNGGTSGFYTGNITNNAAVHFNRSNTTTYSGQISGPGSVTKLGAGLLVLRGNSSYGGGTTVSAGTVDFDQINNFGSGAITVSGATLRHANAAVDISTRTVTIGVGGLTVDTNGFDVTYANSIGNSGGGALTKMGTGTLTLGGANTQTATTIGNGIVSVAADAALGSGSVTLSGGLGNGLRHTASYSTGRSVVVAAGPGGAVSVDPSVTTTYTSAVTGPGNGTFYKSGAGTLALNAGVNLTTGDFAVQAGVAQIPSSATPFNSIVGSISVTTAPGGGQLDMGNNYAVVRSQPVATLDNQIASGRNGGSWDGLGVMTSRSDADTWLTGIGINSADKAFGMLGVGTANFHGTTVVPGDTLVAYTYVGDADLDGNIDGDDFLAIDAGFSAAGTLYGDGDFDYSGTIDADDYFLIDRNYTKWQGTPLAPSLPAGGVTAVPEPGSFAVLGLAAAGLMRRRRRQG